MTRAEAERVAARLVTVNIVPRVVAGKAPFHCVLVAGREVGATLSGNGAADLAGLWRAAIVRALVEE